MLWVRGAIFGPDEAREDAGEAAHARCAAVAIQCLAHGYRAACSPEFADGYSVACQEIAIGIATCRVGGPEAKREAP